MVIVFQTDKSDLQLTVPPRLAISSKSFISGSTKSGKMQITLWSAYLKKKNREKIIECVWTPRDKVVINGKIRNLSPDVYYYTYISFFSRIDDPCQCSHTWSKSFVISRSLYYGSFWSSAISSFTFTIGIPRNLGFHLDLLVHIYTSSLVNS